MLPLPRARVSKCVSVHVTFCEQHSAVLSSSAALASLIKAPDTGDLLLLMLLPPHTSSRWTDARVIIFLGVCKGVTVYVTRRILLKIRPPSVLNSGLISSLPSRWYAWRPPNGHSGCYRQPGSSHLLLPVGILPKSWD